MFYCHELFKTRLKELRKEKKLTQEKLAQLLNISRGAVAHWEVGSRTPGLEIINDLAEILCCTPAYLLGFTDTKQQKVDPDPIHLNNFFYVSEIPMHIIEYDQNDGLNFIDVNDSELTVLGYEKDEFLNLEPKSLCEEIYGDIISKISKGLSEMKNVTLGWVFYITKDGRSLPVELNIFKIISQENKVYLVISKYK